MLAGVDGDGRAVPRVERMTAAMFETIRRVQPAGPYLLAGTSFGGWLAFDLAQRLTAAGEAVAFLGMLDAYGPAYPRFAPAATLRQRAEAWDRRVFRWYRIGPESVRRPLKALARRALYLLKLHRGDWPARLKPDRAKWLSREACVAAKRHYRLRVYPGRITVFPAEPPWPEVYLADPTLGWRPWSSLPIRSVPITGAHGVHMHAPHARGLAAAIEQEINCVLDWSVDSSPPDRPHRR
jgi:thioesterase domain-containing protein